MLRVIRRHDQRKIRQPPVKPVQHVVAGAVPQRKFNQRIFLPESRHPARGDRRRTAVRNRKTDPSRQLPSEGPHLAPRLVRQFQHLRRAPVEQPARLGELQMPLPSYEKRHAEILLHLTDPAAERRLAHMEFFGGAGKIQFLRHCHEVLQSFEIHGRPLYEKHMILAMECVFYKCIRSR